MAVWLMVIWLRSIHVTVHATQPYNHIGLSYKKFMVLSQSINSSKSSAKYSSCATIFLGLSRYNILITTDLMDAAV